MVMTGSRKESRARSSVAALVLGAAVALAPTSSRADESQPIGASLHVGSGTSTTDEPVMRRQTVAELEGGIIALPSAPISKANPSANSAFFGSGTKLFGKGDATILAGLHFLYRWAPQWAFGAGFLFGPSPTAESIPSAPGASRSHSRNYLTVSAQGRFIPLRSRYFEGWVGLALGGVVIADHYETDTPDIYQQYPSVVGSRESNVRTEGFAIGAQAGVSWLVSPSWVIGFAGRVDRWFLPSSPQCDVIYDCATITGAVTAFEMGLTVGYRVPL
jgi:hypothetical protein